MEDLLDRVKKHIEDVKSAPSTQLDEDLFSEVSRQSVLDALPSTSKLSLVSSLAVLLPTLQQDPAPVADVLAALLRGHGLPPFGQILYLEPETDLVAGLKAPHEKLNLVVLNLLGRVETPADVWLIAGKPDVVFALVELWLTTSYTLIAQRAGDILKDMLRIDGSTRDGSISSVEDPTNLLNAPTSTSGLIWRRIFKDKDVYGLIYSSCSLEKDTRRTDLTATQITTAQGRLLDLLSNILSAPQIWESQLPGVEQKFKVAEKGGLLEFAMLRMVDYEDDLLMHLTLIEFFTKLVCSRVGIDSGLSLRSHDDVDSDSSVALDAMIKSGLHERTVAYYLEPKSEELLADYLYGPAGQYIEAYAQTHTSHFRKHMADRVLKKLDMSLSDTTRDAWAHGRAPVHDLRALSSIPRQVILAYGEGCLIHLLPSSPANVASFSALATIFHGPTPEEQKEFDQTHLQLEQASARGLFYMYYGRNMRFWSDLVTAASTTASKETAMAAVNLMKAVISSSWAKLPDANTEGLMSEEELNDYLMPLYTTTNGALVIMMEPTLGKVLPYLLRGPENTSSDAYEVARAKHELIPLLRERLQQAAAEAPERTPPQSWQDMMELLQRRHQLGPLAPSGSSIRIPNPEVSTMEL